jgi:hypothetical protein
MDRWTVEQTYKDGKLDKWTNRQMKRWTSGQVDKQIDGEMDIWTDRQMYKWAKGY